MPAKTDQVYEIDRHPWLEKAPHEIAALTRPDREMRVRLLVKESRRIYELALDALIVERGKQYVGTALLFSGGNDSTTLAHLFRPYVDLAIHANTGIGIEETRQHVRDVCKAWSLPLIERKASKPEDQYRELVLAHGFPGPGQHFKMFQRLKERAFLEVRAELIQHTHRERVVYLGGRRRDESDRRAGDGTDEDPGIPLWEREGSLVWVSPLAYWTKLDLVTYRLMHEPRTDWNDGYVGRCGAILCRCTGVPRNRASQLIHMSGECLCGSFAKRGELDEVGFWFAAAAAAIRALEVEVHAFCRECHGGHIAHERCTWGWGACRTKAPRPSKRVGFACSSCSPANDGDAA